MFRVQSYAYFPTYEKKIVFLHPKRIAMATIKFFRTGSNAPRSQESRREAEDLGVLGEQIASRWLTDRGYAILEKNYHRRRHEVDLIALDGGEVVVVEVKTRSSTAFGTPEEAVDHRKRQTLIRLADNYIRSHRRTEPVRFDILSIVISDGEPDIRHIKNAFNIMQF